MQVKQGVRKGLPWLLLAIAVIVTAAVYWPGLTGGWVFDDYPNIVDNAAIHITAGHSTLTAWVNAALSSPASFLHRPLASITFALNWMSGNGNPWPFKFTNIVIHLVNGVLVFVMLRALLRLLGLRYASRAQSLPPTRSGARSYEEPAVVGAGLPAMDDIPPPLRGDPLPAEGGKGIAGHDPPSVEGGIPAPGTARAAALLPPSERRGNEGDAGAITDHIPPPLPDRARSLPPTRSGARSYEEPAVVGASLPATDGIPPPLRGDPLPAEGGKGIAGHYPLSVEGGVPAPGTTRAAALHPPSERRGNEGDAGAITDHIPPPLRGDPLPAEGGKGIAGHDPLAVEGGVFGSIDERAATRLALVVAAAWMLLPINLMAVLYVVQRMESLCQVFVLAGLWAYLHGRWMMLTATDARRDRRGFALAVGGIVFGTLLGLTSKETAVLLPVFAFLAEWVIVGFARRLGKPPLSESDADEPLSTSENHKDEPISASERHGDEPLSLREGGWGNGPDTRNAPVVAGAASDPSAVTEPSPAPAGHPLPKGEENSIPGTARHPVPGEEGNSILGTARHPVPEGQGNGTSDKRIWSLFTITLFIPGVLGFLWLLRGVLRPGALAGRDFTLGQRLLTEPRVLVDYLHWTLFPNPNVLSLYHDEIVKSTGLLSPWTTLGSMALLAALLVIAVWVRKRLPLVAVGILWFFGSQLLTATIVPLELVYEQRMYFGSIGVLLVAASLLLSLRWKIAWPLLRGFLVAVALLWFAVATNLRAQEWSNPIRLAVAEANRHPTSARAVYEAGRLLLIAANYQPGKVLDDSEKYLKQAAAIPGSSSLPDQALIMIVDHHQQGDDAALWLSMTHKLRNQPTRQEDVSALISLTNCYGADICKFDPTDLDHAYQAALSRPHPIARLDGAYADFQRDILHNDMQAEIYLARAVAGAPSEPAYRIDLAALYARNGQTRQALQQIDALRRLNLLGRLDGQIAALERMAEQGRAPDRK